MVCKIEIEFVYCDAYLYLININDGLIFNINETRAKRTNLASLNCFLYSFIYIYRPQDPQRSLQDNGNIIAQ